MTAICVYANGGLESPPSQGSANILMLLGWRVRIFPNTG